MIHLGNLTGWGPLIPESALMALDAPRLPRFESPAGKKALSAFGHHLSLLEPAVATIQARAAKGKLDPTISEFLERWLHPVVDLDFSAPLSIGLAQTAGRFQIQSLSQGTISLSTWALLRLPSLTRLWAISLRRAHLRHLMAMSPSVWVVDGTPVPPGAVIADLELASWQELTALWGQGRTFELKGPSGTRLLDDQLSPQEWSGAMGEAVSAGDHCLVEHHAADAVWLADYEVSESEIRLSGARAASVGDDGEWEASQLEP